ncbi:hypothetical protein JDV02_006642 [Purpureocillium takamizusanense]|uniref:Uncharacterized protein n=1 Tax=Purpureocillium takamizusanense TaxID=2060973 RepID=A0A9Q8VD82_9HYPO|nr:uncharacterized protein JDV02_006642 [Purpureocillium takamizusanense]UNI20567.1 hypothetical protein JDV02_006642 [Purpureocillium takamizusanense]
MTVYVELPKLISSHSVQSKPNRLNMSPGLAQQGGTSYNKPARRSRSLAVQGSLVNKTPRAGGSPTSGTKMHAPDSQRTNSKLTEALKNPNWRDRGIESGSSSSANLSMDESRIHASDDALSRPRGWPSSSSGNSYAVEPDDTNKRKVSAIEQMFYPLPPANATPQGTTPKHAAGKPTVGAEASGLFRVLGQRKLEGWSKGPDMFLLDVSDHHENGPAKHLGGDVSDTSAHMQHGPVTIISTHARQAYTGGSRAGVNLAHKGGYTDHGVYGDGNLQTFHRSDPLGHRSRPETRNGLHASPSTRNLESFRHSNVYETGAISQHHFGRITAETPAVREVVTGARLTTYEEESRANLDAKNEAFQRMLDKLKKPARPSVVQAQVLRGSSPNSGHGHDTFAHGPSGLAQHDASSHDVVPVARREFTVSDFTVPYGRVRSNMHETEFSSDSTTSTTSSARNNSLNPKAREFLSFKHSLRRSPRRDNEGLFQDPIYLRLRDSQHHDASESTGWGEADLDETKPDSTPDPFIRHYDRIGPIQALNLTRAPDVRNLVPLQPAPGLPYPFVPAVDVAAYPPDPTQLVEVPHVLPSLYTGASIFARPSAGTSACSGTAPAYRSLPSRLQYPPLPVAPQPAAYTPAPAFPRVPAGRPVPVPKPQMPNAREQQAYEAYIEQRKAMEPGYAMECRQRQQRRAKRNQAARLGAAGAP